MPFSMLLNIVGSSNAKNKDILWKFIKKFHKDINPKNHKILDALTSYAINYFVDEVEPKKKYKKPNKDEQKALQNLISILKKIPQSTPAEEIQTMIYTAGKENGYSDSLRNWFKLIYEVTFGEINGPRMGFFISFFGVKETIDLMEKKLKMQL
jgi:lysyl-tRNA synthetase class 1